MIKVSLCLYESEEIKENKDVDIKNALDSLVKTLASRADYIIPIARRGIRVLELSSESDNLFKKGKILIYDSVKFHARELKNKRIILFDEGAYSGRSLLNAKRELRDLSNKMNLNFTDKISTMSLVVNADNVKKYPDHYSLLVNSDIYDYISQTLDYMILSSGKPMDVDHLIVRVRIPEKEMPRFFEILRDEFHAIEPSHSGLYGSVRMFTIDLNLEDVKSIFSFFIPEISGIPRLFDSGVKKIRIYQKCDVVHIVPIVYPAIEVNDRISNYRDNCPFWHTLKGASICDVMPQFSKDNRELKNIICNNCIVNGLNVNLVTEFLTKLRTFISYGPLELDDKCLQIVSHNEGTELAKALNERIQGCLTARKLIDFGKTRAKKAEIKTELAESVDPCINQEFRLKTYEAILELILKNEKANEELFVKIDKDKIKKWHKELSGLTYDQIRQGLIGVCEEEFSEGMDIGMDVGSIKPMMPYKGVRISCEGNYYNAVVRMFTLSGEETESSTYCLLYFLGRIDLV